MSELFPYYSYLLFLFLMLLCLWSCFSYSSCCRCCWPCCYCYCCSNCCIVITFIPTVLFLAKETFRKLLLNFIFFLSLFAPPVVVPVAILRASSSWRRTRCPCSTKGSWLGSRRANWCRILFRWSNGEGQGAGRGREKGAEKGREGPC